MTLRNAFALALLALAVACGGEEKKEPEAPAVPAPAPAPAPESPAAPAPAAPAPAPGAGAAAAPEAAAAAGTPFACIPGDATRGATQYATLCASCHGPGGGGDGPASAGLNPKPAKHHDGAYMNTLTNEHLYKVIKEGGASVGKSPLMAPWGGALNEQQLWDVVAFVRSLAEPKYSCP